jgi:ribosomal protein S18 acetylase RimI-like enzyme
MSAAAPVQRRPATDADRPFLLALYASTREREMAIVPWTAEQKAAFLAMQFEAQDTHYRDHYRDATFEVLERDGRPIGRLYLDDRAEQIRIIDIALAPECRGHGTGTLLLREIQETARASGRAVTIHVDLENRAIRFYERLGFAPVEQRGAYVFMQWPPAAAAAPPAAGVE